MDLSNKTVYFIHIDYHAGILYLRKQKLRYVIKKRSDGLQFTKLFTTEKEAENTVKKYKKDFKDKEYKIKKNY